MPIPGSSPQTTIRQRLLRVVMTTALAALLLSASVLLLYELRSHRDGWLQQLQMQADLLARASLSQQGAIDARAAHDKLALLGDQADVDAAGLYDAEGRLLAAHVAPGRPAPPARLGAASGPPRFVNQRIELRRPVRQDGRLLGTLVVAAHYAVLPRLLDYLSILTLVVLAGMVLAGLVAQGLQRSITEPIIAVAAVARQVVQKRDYRLRAPRTTQDEVGALVDAFNDMLRELGEQAEALQAADRRKDEYLATLAHELRNPLAPITTALAILARTDGDAAMRARLLDMMQRQTRQLVRLIDELMEVSRLSTGRLQLQPEKLDLVEVVRAAFESVAPLLLEARHTLEVDWPGPVWVRGDRLRLGQVFANLLGNAARYTPPGGHIGIEFELAPATVAVRVRDDGVGIAPERQAEVFEMFSRVDAGASARRDGLGVGLAVARQLVQLHEGQLRLYSAGLGFGAVFTVLLPRLTGAEAAAPASGTPGPRPLPSRQLTVLLADDNVDFADSLAALLRGEGHRVTVAHDGREALRLAREQLPDVGLLDIGMPGMDGFALAQALRAEPGGSACLLVAITGWGQQADRQRSREAGFDAHLVKPVDPEALLALLARGVGLHPPADGAEAG